MSNVDLLLTLTPFPRTLIWKIAVFPLPSAIIYTIYIFILAAGSAMSVLGEDYGAKGGKPKGGKSRVNPLTGEAIDVAPSFNSDELVFYLRFLTFSLSL